MEIVFILDFGNKFGWGHLSRCSNLALHLNKYGIKSFLITSRIPENKNNSMLLKRLISAFGKNTIFVKTLLKGNELNLHDLEVIKKLVKDKKVIIDHYFLNKDIIKYCYQASTIFQFNDDLNDINYLDPNNVSHKSIYLLPEECIPKLLLKRKNVFGGLDLFPIFPPEIKFDRPKEYLPRNINVLATPGEAGKEFLIKLIYQIESFKENKIKIFAPKSYDISSSNLEQIEGGYGLLNFIYFSDIVISAAGNTMLESIYLNIPAIIFSTNNNQLSVIEHFEKQKKIVYVDDAKQIKVDLFRNLKGKTKSTKKNNLNFSCKKMLDLLIKE